jgi:hypothetical protein
VLTRAAPSPRVNAAIAFDPVNQVFLLFGGLEEDGAALQDTWVLERTNSAEQLYSWTQIHP